jgi:HD-GYP domain-containing protein (c-di-GMP phosphodiesterase class II)
MPAWGDGREGLIPSSLLMFDRVVLSRDLVDARGTILARRGTVLSPAAIAEAALRAPPLPRDPLSGTPFAEDVYLPLTDPAYRHLFRGGGVQSAVARAVLAVRLPQPLMEELLALKGSDPGRFRHALTTAAVTVRMLVAALGPEPALADLAAAGLLHDLGMRHVSFHLLRTSDRLADEEVAQVAAHPLLGAWHLASVLGRHPAVDAALGHHWRNGHGYPALPQPPPRSVEVVAVASAFAALTQARPFRSDPFDARGAIDVLVADGQAGLLDLETVRLLVHALRGAQGEIRHVRFGRDRLGHAPTSNRHTPIAAARVA